MNRPIILPLLIWLSIIGCAILLMAGLSGCASSPSPRSEVCFLRILGSTENGMPVVAQTCMTPEAFAESQK